MTYKVEMNMAEKTKNNQNVFLFAENFDSLFWIKRKYILLVNLRLSFTVKNAIDIHYRLECTHPIAVPHQSLSEFTYWLLNKNQPVILFKEFMI